MCDGVGTTRGSSILTTLAAVVIIAAGMKEAVPILVPFLLSVFIAIICAPPLLWLTTKGLPKTAALLLVMAGILAAGLLVGTLAGASLRDFYQTLPEYQLRLREETSHLLAWIERRGINIADLGLIRPTDPGTAMQLVASVLTGLGGVLTNAFFIFLTVIFMLLEASAVPAKLRAILPEPDRTLEYCDRFLGNVKRYMAIKTWISIGTGAAVAALLWILGVDYPLLWGTVAFLFNFVPNIGSILASIPPVLLAFVQFGGTRALLAAAGCAVVNFIMGNVIEPRTMGRGVGLSPLVIFLSLVFWGWILGPVGMLLSVPLTMTVKIALESGENTRWLAVLLGPEASQPRPKEAPRPPAQDLPL